MFTYAFIYTDTHIYIYLNRKPSAATAPTTPRHTSVTRHMSYLHTYIYIYIHLYIHIYNTYIHIYIHMHMIIYVLIYMHTHIYIYLIRKPSADGNSPHDNPATPTSHVVCRIHIHICIHMYMLSYVFIYIHTHIYVYLIRKPSADGDSPHDNPATPESYVVSTSASLYNMVHNVVSTAERAVTSEYGAVI